jgi:hypothetical protein
MAEKSGDLQNLRDRADVSDVVIRYATALDQRNWPLLRSILTDQIHIDYSSFFPALDTVMAADDWVAGVTKLSRFYATQHLSTNHVHSIDGDEASCVSYVQAAHFLTWEDVNYACFLYGHYTNLLTRTDTGWKIRKCTLQVTASLGDARVFEWAFGSAVNIKPPKLQPNGKFPPYA